MAGPFFVYILRCSDGSLYVGHTADINERVRAHNDGWGAFSTAWQRPAELLLQEWRQDEREAVARERRLKLWSHQKKLALINGDWATLKDLAQRRVR
jgi:predicted GIY-YIG superfamily endonuclease